MSEKFYIFATPKNHSGPRLHFTDSGGVGKFADHGRRAPFETLEDAKQATRWMISHFPILRGYWLEIESVSDYRLMGKWRMNPIGLLTLINSGSAAKTLGDALPTASRRKNPSKRDAQKDNELQRGAKLLKDFSGHAPTEVLRVKQDPISKGLVIGTLDAVPYTTIRDGRTERYIHTFKRRARPLLVASSDGRRLGIVGGRFQFTEAGIVDD